MGREGRGASNHCAHGKGVSTEVTLDWRPFEYSTADSFDNGRKTLSETLRFEALPGGGTRVHSIMQVHMPLPRLIRRIVAHIMVVHVIKYDRALAKAVRLAEEEYNQIRELNES